MRYDTKTDCGFRIDTPLDPREWGFFITVLKPLLEMSRAESIDIISDSRSVARSAV